MNVELRDEAREDLVDGAFFYGQQAEGMDKYFLRYLREDIKKLESTGGIHEQCYGFYRSLSERFPYAIYYLVARDIVDVVAVLDCRRDPALIASRLGRTNP